MGQALARIRRRSQRAISRFGATASFSRTTPVYDPATDSSVDTVVSATAPAMQTKGDPDRFIALGLVLTDPITLLVSGVLTITPKPGDRFTFASKSYTVSDCEPIAPDGIAAYYRVIGSG